MFKKKVSTVPGLSSSSAPGAAAAAVHVPTAAVLLHAPAGPLSAAAVLLLAPAGPLSAASVLPSAAFVLYPNVAADWQSLLHPVQPKLLYELPWPGALLTCITLIALTVLIALVAMIAWLWVCYVVFTCGLYVVDMWLLCC